MMLCISHCIRITEVMRTLTILPLLASLCWARTLETEGSEGRASFESESESGEAGGDGGTEWFIPPALFHLKNGTSVTWADLEKAGAAEKFEEGLKPKKAGEKTREPSNKSLRLNPADRRKGRKAKGRR